MSVDIGPFLVSASYLCFLYICFFPVRGICSFLLKGILKMGIYPCCNCRCRIGSMVVCLVIVLFFGYILVVFVLGYVVACLVVVQLVVVLMSC